jgi:hypothetical protein
VIYLRANRVIITSPQVEDGLIFVLSIYREPETNASAESLDEGHLREYLALRVYIKRSHQRNPCSMGGASSLLAFPSTLSSRTGSKMSRNE